MQVPPAGIVPPAKLKLDPEAVTVPPQLVASPAGLATLRFVGNVSVKLVISASIAAAVLSKVNPKPLAISL